MFDKIKLNRLLKKANNLYQKRERGGKVNLKNEALVLKQIAQFYAAHQYNKKYQHAEIFMHEYYRAAAALEDAEAQYILGKIQLEAGKFWHEWQQGHYGEPVHQYYAEQCFKEAFAFFEQADQNGYPLAKRLHGMALIHGWGKPMDEEAGFKMVVASIEEAKEWDRATEIFKELGLNKPEFFSTLMKMKERA